MPSNPSPVNIHLKAQLQHITGPSKPYAHTLEQRIAMLAARFAAIEKRLEQQQKAGAAAAPKVKKDLSNLAPCKQDTPEVAKLREQCKTIPLHSAQFKWVPSDYYTKPLPWRKEQLGAPSIQYLCKSIVLENTHCKNEDCSVETNSRYYVAVFQYVERFDAEKVLRFVKGMNEGMGKKQFNFRLADPEVSQKMTGFGYNAVVPFGTAVKIPVILSEKITKLSPAYFWMGGGHVDCKVRVDTEEFLESIKPFVADITNPIPEEELSTLTGY